MDATVGRDGNVIVVGASIAGVTAVEELRRLGHQGSITLIGDESSPPYARPPLSKGVLCGAESPAATYLPALDDQAAHLLTGRKVMAVDPVDRRVRLDDGEELSFDGLVIASGARARTMRDIGAADDGVHEVVLRSLDDCMWLADALSAKPQVLIVGAGFLGMEIASVCVDLGLCVTLIDRLPPLRAQCGDVLSQVLTGAARDRGVQLLLQPDGVRLVRFDDRTAVQLADGALLEADLVITAIGDMPNAEWLDGSGLALPCGVPIDQRCRVSVAVVAAGDVTAARGSDGRLLRSPHWYNAIEQARTAAAALLLGDQASPYVPRPYVWTEQFGLAVKMCGQFPAAGHPEELAGSIAERSVLLRWTDGGTAAAAAINRRIAVSKLQAYAGQPKPHM